MSGSSYWRREANRAIRDAIDAGREKGLSGIELEKYVRANGYPFGERAMHPYKIWLSAMKAWFARETRLTISETEAYNDWLAEMKKAFPVATKAAESCTGRPPG